MKDRRARWIVMAKCLMFTASLLSILFGHGTEAFAAKASDYADVFAAEYYAEHHPDVKAAFGGSKSKLLAHFLAHGMSEGRQANAEFSVHAYRARYADLETAFGDDLKQYYLHYIRCGKKEGRSALPDGQTAAASGTQAGDSGSGAEVPSANSKQPVRDGSNWRSIPGTEDPSYEKAAAVLQSLGWNIRRAFDWCASTTYYGHGKADMPEDGSPGVHWFADFGFTNRKGNCYVMASMFYEFAKLCGYHPRQMTGSVPLRRGGLGPHSWVEIDVDGVTYVYDPDFTYGTKKNGFKIQYGQSGTWKYQDHSQMSE